TESYNGIRIRILPDGKPVTLTRKGDVLTSGGQSGHTTGASGVLDGGSSASSATAGQVNLNIKGLDTKPKDDDQLVGTWFGKKAVFWRDVAVKPPVEINMAGGVGDRPWVRFMREVLIPKSAEDRETYHRFDAKKGGDWIMNTELGAKGYWITKGWIKDQA